MLIGELAMHYALKKKQKKTTHFAVTVQLDNIKAKNLPKSQSIRPKLYR